MIGSGTSKSCTGGSDVPLRGSRVGSHGHEVAVAHRTDVGHLQREQCLRAAGSRHEFHLQAVGVIDLDHRTEVATLQAVAWNVRVQHDDIERLEGHGSSPGYAVTNRG